MDRVVHSSLSDLLVSWAEVRPQWITRYVFHVFSKWGVLTFPLYIFSCFVLSTVPDVFWSVWKFFKHLKHFSPGPDLLFSFTIQTRCFTKVNNRKTTVLSECLIIWMVMVILTSNWQTSLSFCLRIWYDKSLIWTEKHYNCKSVANVEIRLQVSDTTSWTIDELLETLVSWFIHETLHTCSLCFEHGANT